VNRNTDAAAADFHLRLVINRSRDYLREADDPDNEFGMWFMHHRHGAGLKLVWLDGSEMKQAQLQDCHKRR